jgi:ElaB/YqjD/DUF883 family membrane-anchored ribosome-binding protein
MAERRDQPLEPGDVAFVPGSSNPSAGGGAPPPRGTDASGDRDPAQIHQDIRETRAEMSRTLHDMEEHFDPDNVKDLSSSPVSARTPEAERLQRDIRHTRAEMSETLDELGHRLSPHYIKEQVKDSVRSTAHDAGTNMLDTIKQNPIPSLIAGLSIGWLIAKAGQSDDRDRYDYDRYYRGAYYGPEYGGGRYNAGREPYGNRERYDEHGRSLADRAGDLTHEARDRATDVAHEAREWVGDVADPARDVASEAGHRVQDAAYEARRYGRRATNWLERTMEDNPLAAGAVALAAGALVGLAVPETEPEHRLMGEASDRVKEQAQHLAEEKLDQVKAVASETLDEAKEGAQKVASTARSEAQDVARTAEQESRRQGLTSGS